MGNANHQSCKGVVKKSIAAFEGLTNSNIELVYPHKRGHLPPSYIRSRRHLPIQIHFQIYYPQ